MKWMSEIKCHTDGISIPGIGSIRLSNAPKNLFFIAQCVVTSCKQAPVIILAGLGLVGTKVKASNSCYEYGSYSNVYLNNTNEAAFLQVKYSYPEMLGPINNT